ncbi:MAG: ATP-binding protein [Planctomycetes bacterium]|nr:ATP-binding protein [Planctomycetota bacterium]
MEPNWGFYGRRSELESLASILRRGRWFFARISGRRRIGKTTLIQKALQEADRREFFYFQVPDSGPAGVLAAVRDAAATFPVPAGLPLPTNLLQLARFFGLLAERGFIVAIDEFQYFNRQRINEFCSHLQAEVDRLGSQPGESRGGLIVLGSIHTEVSALLDDRTAPLYNRTTDELDLGHLDVASVLEILRIHADDDPARLLFLWNLFEGVPKFYRDCYEVGILGSERREFLRRAFFESSSPLRYEADNWFLKELHGRYDVVLRFLSRRPGATQGDVQSHVTEVNPDGKEQVGGYLKILADRYRMVERKLPVFARPTARKGRYYLTDNFLRSWLRALAGPVSAVHFRPIDELVGRADEALAQAEGVGFERLVATLYEERSRKGLAGFPLSHRIDGWWDRGDVEIDLVALDDEKKRIRLGHCRRSSRKLLEGVPAFRGHVSRFLEQRRELAGWEVELVAIAPRIPEGIRRLIRDAGLIPEDLRELTDGL